MERSERRISLDSEVEAFCLMVARQAFEDDTFRTPEEDALTLFIVFRDELNLARRIYYEDGDHERKTKFWSVGLSDFLSAVDSELEYCILTASASPQDSIEQIEALDNALFWHQVAEAAEIAVEDDRSIYPDMARTERVRQIHGQKPLNQQILTSLTPTRFLLVEDN